MCNEYNINKEKHSSTAHSTAMEWKEKEYQTHRLSARSLAHLLCVYNCVYTVHKKNEHEKMKWVKQRQEMK